MAGALAGIGAVAHKFSNSNPQHYPNRPGAILKWGIWDRLTGKRKIYRPGAPTPDLQPDLELVVEQSSKPQLTWIGHASFVGTLERLSFVIDPVFSNRIGSHTPRYGAASLKPGQLPKLSSIMVTHNHYDHLDGASLRALPGDVPVVVPLGLASWFRRWNPRPVIELDWRESVQIAGLEITLVPSRHWSRRWLFDTNRTLWGGFVVRVGRYSVYHAGDSGWFDGFQEIGRRFPDLDVAMLPIGSYSPAWFMEKHHMNPEQAGRAFLDLGARRLIPMHWGAFQLTDEPISEPIGRMVDWWQREQPSGITRLCRLAVGETLVLDEES